jgi:hypothetical protein
LGSREIIDGSLKAIRRKRIGIATVDYTIRNWIWYGEWLRLRIDRNRQRHRDWIVSSIRVTISAIVWIPL